MRVNSQWASIQSGIKPSSNSLSRRPRPQRFGQLVHHAIELAAQQFVELLGAAVGGEGVVDEGVVQHQLVAQLFAQAV